MAVDRFRRWRSDHFRYEPCRSVSCGRGVWATSVCHVCRQRRRAEPHAAGQLPSGAPPEPNSFAVNNESSAPGERLRSGRWAVELDLRALTRTRNVAMDAQYSVEIPQAFIVGEHELKKLTDLLADRIGDCEIRADCVDDIARTFKTVREFAAFENAPRNEIRRLHISARSDDFKKRATVDLSGSRWRGISLGFEARDDVVSRLRTEVLDIIAGMRPWYSVLHRVDFVGISFLTYFLLWFASSLVVTFKWMPAGDAREEDPTSSAAAQLIVYGGIAVLFGMGFLLNWFRDSIFPRAVFVIGQGKNRFQHLERIQWGIVIAFVVSFVASAVIAVWQATAA